MFSQLPEMIKKKKLSVIFLCFTLIISLLFGGCARGGAEESVATRAPSDTDCIADKSVLLQAGEDQGQEYIDSFIFIGESTTYHMKSRGVLSGGTDTKQVWAPSNGTINLDLTIDTLKIVYPETGEQITISQAAERKKPEYVLLTFGLNGAVQNVKKGAEYYKSCYSKLTDAILSSSPHTKIIIQAGYPVASNMDMSRYSVDLRGLNSCIDTVNCWAYEFASERGFAFLDTGSVLKNENNELKYEYQCGDGYHLTTEAYRVILQYIRTHPYRT